MGPPALSFVNMAGVIVGGIAQFFLNSFIIWLLANHFMALGEKTPFKRCMLCVLTLALVSGVALAILMFLPIPLINFVGALFVWWKGSLAAIEGSLEINEGSFRIFIIYIMISSTLIYGSSALLS